MKERKLKLAYIVLAAVFALIIVGIWSGKATESVINSLIALFGSIVLFYMGGNVGEHFAVRKQKKNDTDDANV